MTAHAPHVLSFASSHLLAIFEPLVTILDRVLSEGGTEVPTEPMPRPLGLRLLWPLLDLRARGDTVSDEAIKVHSFTGLHGHRRGLQHKALTIGTGPLLEVTGT